LPLVWGEGDVGDVLNARTARSETLTALDAQFDIRAIDTVSAATLAHDLAIIAQPRRLSPSELVALDKWIRDGGRALIFADPELVWPSRYALGDVRRPPPVEMLDPLFAHWGLALGDSDRRQRVVKMGGQMIVTAAAGTWHAPKTCAVPDPLVLDCRIGKGRAILVGDADMLDARLWQQANADNPAWIAAQLRTLGSISDSIRKRLGLSIGVIASAIIVCMLVLRPIQRT
jgi:ABC-type uncharacterized transport system